MLFFNHLTYIYIGDYMLDRVKNYIRDDEFRMTLYNNKINIVNYKLLISLEDNYISFKTINKKINIIGKDLVLKKLLDNELLIKGTINKIEVIDE